VRDELSHLATKAFTPSAVRSEPLIGSGSAAENEKALALSGTNNQPDPTTNEAAPVYCLMIGGLLIRGTDCILDVCVTNTDRRQEVL
jgi:hypothetical protein